MSGRRGRGRGGRGGGRGDRGEVPRTVQISKKLSWLLRHGAESENLPLGPGGFANLADVLSNRKLRGLQITFEEVQLAVSDNEKQRFTMVPIEATAETGSPQACGSNNILQDPTSQSSIPSTNPKAWKIRANQGHSLKIEAEGLLEPITGDDVPDIAVHGTTHAAWVSIVSSGGLKPMTRNHIHFAPGLPIGFQTIVDADVGQAQAPVISGMRTSSTVLIYVDLRKAIESGVKFWRSDNGVILSEGDEKGLLPMKFFQKVEDRIGEGVLVQDGVVVKEAPQQWAKGNPGGRR